MHETVEIDPAEIKMSPNNPRLVFDPVDLERLRESLDEVGILVPLTVYRVGDQVRLIDGERRLRCALELGFDAVPCVVVEDVNETEELEWMFSIHMMREQWDEGPTAKALKALAERMGGWDSDKLKAVTGFSNQRLNFFRALAECPPDVLDRVIAGDLPANLIADSILRVANPLRAELPDIIGSRSDAEIIKAMVEKRDTGFLPDVVSLRDLRTMIRVASEDTTPEDESSELREAISRVLDNSTASIEEAYEDTIETRIAAQSFTKTVERFKKSVMHVVREVRGDAEAIATLIEDLRSLENFVQETRKELAKRK